MRVIQIGLLGLGTVGSGVIEILRRRKEEWSRRYGVQVNVKKILVQNLEKSRSVEVDPTLLTTHYEEILQDSELEVIVEVMGGEELALTVARQTLKAKKHLVTANKLMLAKYGPELFSLAREMGVQIGFEASVGGGIPIIQPLSESLNANEIQSLQGIINGTTNYILTAMSEKQESYYDVLEKAQVLGYAEADPTSDVEGLDACYKLSVLTGVAFSEQLPVGEIATTGISKITLADLMLARELGYVIKLIASAKRVPQGLVAHVHPTLLPIAHPLSHVHGVNNALLVKGDAVGEVLFFGPGAGMMATGSAVTSDLIRICREIAGNAPVPRDMREALTFAGKSNAFQGESDSVGGARHQKDYFFITIHSTAPVDGGEIAHACYTAGVPLKSISCEDDGDLYHSGIFTGEVLEQEVLSLVENLSKKVQYRQINYYYVERGPIR